MNCGVFKQWPRVTKNYGRINTPAHFECFDNLCRGDGVVEGVAALTRRAGDAQLGIRMTSYLIAQPISTQP